MEASEFPTIAFPQGNARRQQRAAVVADTLIPFLREGIESGRIEAGTYLPSETALHEHWGVSRPIVHLGLEAAEAAGLVERTNGNGWKAAWRALPPGSPQWRQIAQADGVGHFWRQDCPDGSWLSVFLDRNAMWRYRHIGAQANVVHAEGFRTDEMAARRAATDYLKRAAAMATSTD